MMFAPPTAGFPVPDAFDASQPLNFTEELSNGDR